MDKVSIIIPARGESKTNLNKTIESVVSNATGKYEIIVGFDGITSYSGTFENDFVVGHYVPDLELKIIEFPNTVGIKTNINAMCAMATGKYIYKSDAHCRFGKGFDEILQNEMSEDWIVMPRFKIIKEDWSIQMRDGQEEFYDYFYLCCPFTDPKGFRFKAGGHWKERTTERNTTPLQIDETPQIHGSGWFMTKDRFFELGGFPNIDPYGHAQEPIWLALKNQLMGGKCMVNKKTWYAHLHQQGNKRGYHMDKAQENKSYDIACKTFMNDPRMVGWLENNMPMPTWPDNWKELLTQWKLSNT